MHGIIKSISYGSYPSNDWDSYLAFNIDNRHDRTITGIPTEGILLLWRGGDGTRQKKMHVISLTTDEETKEKFKTSTVAKFAGNNVFRAMKWISENTW